MSTLKKYINRCALAAVTFFSLISFVHAASFDCAKAGTAIERQICSDGYLNGLDDILGANYKKMMAANIGSRAQDNLKSTQMQWLASRNRCQDRQCLVNAYKVRIEEICAYPVLSGMHPSCGTPDDYKHLDAGDLISELDGNWYSPQWKYGYVMKNGVGVATSTNSPNFQVGQKIIELRPSSHTSFSGQQVYTDGKFYNIEAQLINGKLHFQGEKNAKWVMERVGGSPSPQAAAPSQTTAPVQPASPAQTAPQARAQPQTESAGTKEFSVVEKAGICSGYHSGYAMIANSTGARNDRDHSVRVITQLDTQYASSPGYKNMQSFAIRTMTDAMKTQNFGMIREMMGMCQQVGAPGAINTGR